MKALLPLFVFVDACGWEIIKKDPFVQAFAPCRRKLTSVFGYSSACVPSILSGRWPVEHRNWSYFAYDPAHSPFKRLAPLRWVPSQITNRRFFRRWLSRLVKEPLGFSGYFDLYNLPFRYISLFDFTEKRSPLRPGGMNRGPNIFDYLEQQNILYHVSAPEQAERANLDTLLHDLRTERVDFAFLYWPGLDGLMHRVGNQSPQVPAKLRSYEKWLAELVDVAAEHYSDVRLYVFSDHGMANCDQVLDLQRDIDALPCRFARDYVAAYDSTMARFWFFQDAARRQITQCLEAQPLGRILPDAELEELGALFPDRYFGELIFLVQEGVLIAPSHMGQRPINAMHGYHPKDPQSYAALCTNQPDLPKDITAIPHMFRLMMRDAELAKARNAAPLAAPDIQAARALVRSG